MCGIDDKIYLGGIDWVSWLYVEVCGNLTVFYGKRRVKKKKTRLEGMKIKSFKIQLFRERLSERVQTTIPKGIVGGFVFTVFQRNLKEWHEKPWIRSPERATSILGLCHGVFTDQFIFRHILGHFFPRK